VSLTSMCLFYNVYNFSSLISPYCMVVLQCNAAFHELV
jgi:hypothetical protein